MIDRAGGNFRFPALKDTQATAGIRKGKEKKGFESVQF